MKMIQVGIIGVGFGQQVHLPAFHSVPDCRVTAVCASSMDKAIKIAQRHQVDKAYGDWKTLIDDSEIDVVSVALPPAIQPDAVEYALQRGKSVFCEKPVSVDKKNSMALADLAGRCGCANMVDFEFPEIPQWRQTKALLSENSIGALRHIAVSWNVETYANRNKLETWKCRTEEGGGVLHQFVSHVFHAIEWFVEPIETLAAQLFRTPGDKRSGETLCTVQAQLKSGLPVVITVCSHAYMGNGHCIDLFGEDGTIRLVNTTTDYIKGFQLKIATRESNHFERIDCNEGFFESFADGRIAAVASLVQRMVQWVQTGEASTPSLKEGARVQLLIDAAQRSQHSGQWVRVE